ncbi:MAG: S1 RNA-binding domain-containing protein, partial [Dongiaceae bacterium]
MSDTSAAGGGDMKESFSALLDESLGKSPSLEGSVLKGRVIAIENDFAIIDVGLKSEGRVPLKEFALPGQRPEIRPGDSVEVFLERMEDKNGEAMLSREKARREESWAKLEQSFKKNERV